MTRLEQDLSLPSNTNRRYEDLTHSVPFGAHSFIENQAEHGIYYASTIHSNANHVPLMRRSKDGSSRTIKHLTWKQFLAGEDEKDKFAGYVKQEKQRYKALADAKDSFSDTLDGLKDAVKGYYESSNSLRSRRLVTAHSVSLGVASDLTKKTIEDVQRDTAFLKKRGNSLHNATEAVADYFEETKTVIDDLHRYVREKAVRSNGVAADDAHNQGEPGDMRGRLAVWSAHLRPSTGKLIERAYDRSKALDDEMDYRK